MTVSDTRRVSRAARRAKAASASVGAHQQFADRADDARAWRRAEFHQRVQALLLGSSASRRSVLFSDNAEIAQRLSEWSSVST